MKPVKYRMLSLLLSGVIAGGYSGLADTSAIDEQSNAQLSELWQPTDAQSLNTIVVAGNTACNPRVTVCEE